MTETKRSSRTQPRRFDIELHSIFDRVTGEVSVGGTARAGCDDGL
jgi:hypothetical protein